MAFGDSIVSAWSRTAIGAAAILASAGLIFAGRSTALAEDKADQPKADAAVSQAVLAYQLAIQGQRTKSPVLMLAAVEMIGPLKTKAAPSDLKIESAKKGNPGAALVSFDTADWQEKAREFAKGDKQLLAFVEDRIEKMSSRGIINAPAGSYVKYFGSTPYTVLNAGFLGRGESATLGNILVTGGQFACVGVVGEIGSELFLSVAGDAGSKEGGQSFRGFAIYSWTPKRTHAVAIQVTNTGDPCAYVIIGH